MKVLIDHQNPFLLMHGGLQIQIEQTKAALDAIGVDTEFLRWWDPSQRADVIHFYGRPSGAYIDFAHQKGIKIVMLHLLTGLGSRAAWKRRVQKIVTSAGIKALPGLAAAYKWDAYRSADALIANTAWEKYLMHDNFGVPLEKIHIVPNGVEEVFLRSAPVERGEWLVCTATIAGRKRVLELAQAAATAQTPLWIIGKPYGENDPYAQQFLTFAKQNPKFIRYEGPVSDRGALAKIYRAARGFVLLSTMETRSLSSEEAAACECPLFLSDLPWARDVFHEQAAYCPADSSPAQIAPLLKKFYDEAPSRPKPAKPKSWTEVAHEFRAVYESVLR
ncbi:MAG TPA: glycosyltransferase family 4 protein [Verrucomicrobiae bacterium]|jgi:glycosyltransferase involved in cell wall biosynthesis|nr:glycosyltransferase family 4 protein [Verrucomicrobiae bacterium]